MSVPLVTPKQFAIKSILINQLSYALGLQKITQGSDKVANIFDKSYLPHGGDHLSWAIPLNKVEQNLTRILYVSAIALKFSNRFDESSIDLAQKIGTRLTESISVSQETRPVAESFQEYIWADVTLQIVPPGWIYLQLNNQGLASWLQMLIEQPLSMDNQVRLASINENDNQSLRDSTKIFLLQYSHARCCSQLYLAQSEGLVEFFSFTEEKYHNRSQGRLSQPNPVPWLTEDVQLRVQSAAEFTLMAQLVDVLDGLFDLASRSSSNLRSGQPVLKLGESLGQAYLNFYAQCPLWGESRKTDVALTQVRLGLVLITQSILRMFLEDLLGCEAPQEL